MKIIVNIILSLLIVSCGTFASSEYQLEPIAAEKMTWRFCEARDGLEVAYSGQLCYAHKECKRSRLFRVKKCRKRLIVCDPKNDICMQKWKIYQKKIH